MPSEAIDKHRGFLSALRGGGSEALDAAANEADVAMDDGVASVPQVRYSTLVASGASRHPILNTDCGSSVHRRSRLLQRRPMKARQTRRGR